MAAAAEVHAMTAGRLTGRLPAELGNAVSDAIHAAVAAGMAMDEAVCVVVAVAADYGRLEYGAGYLRELADVVMRRDGGAT
jgi:hypothetical protein